MIKDFTNSEQTLVRMLAAWEQWGGHGAETDVDDAVLDIDHVLRERGFTDDKGLTAAAIALRDRARKAGVL